MGKNKMPKKPFVSVCTPTFNRRPFIPIIIKCFENQTYPREKMEWIIVDDGTDKIEDLVSHLPYVKYFKYDEKMHLGKKRNITNEKASGDIIVYMDDDDYYPPDRVKHAVESLRDSKALIAGSSAMFIYFKHITKMYQFGPYGANHSTAATFAFKKELLKITKFNEDSSLAEEKKFLKDYTIPMVQLDPKKSILVVSHNHNSFDKKELLKQIPNPHIHDTPITPSDLIKEPEILQFFIEDINILLDDYQPGRIENKPDVIIQMEKIKLEREDLIRQQIEYQNTLSKFSNPINMLDEKNMIIQQLINENNQLKEQVQYLNNKIKQLLSAQLEKIKEEKMKEKKIELNSDFPIINN